MESVRKGVPGAPKAAKGFWWDIHDTSRILSLRDCAKADLGRATKAECNKVGLEVVAVQLVKGAARA